MANNTPKVTPVFNIEVSYVDINGTDRTETLYFSLTRSELAAFFNKHRASIGKLGAAMVDNDSLAGVEFVSDLIEASIGFKEGDLIVKDENAKNKFRYNPPLNDAVMEKLMGDDATAKAFVNGLLPQSILEQIEKEQAKAGGN